jgi:hypothetical protein
MSPIEGLTNRGEGLPQIGDIRKGAPKKEGAKRPGQDLDYFRVDFLEGEEDAAATWNALGIYEPRELSIVLLFNEIDRFWDAWLEAYQAGALLARSDGEKFLYLRDHKTGEVIVQKGIEVATGEVRKYTDGEVIHSYTKNKEKVEVICKPVGRLRVLLPELQRLAYMIVHTTSIHDIINISEQLAALKKINGGVLVGIPMLLKRRPKMISTPREGGKRVRSKKWLLSIEADPIWVKAKLQEMDRAALPGNGLALLPETAPEPEVVEGEIVEDNPEHDPDAPVLRFTTKMYEWAAKEGLAPDIKSAEYWLGMSNLPMTNDKELVKRWLQAFERGIDINEGREDLAAVTANKSFEKAAAE